MDMAKKVPGGLWVIEKDYAISYVLAGLIERALL